MAGCSKQQNQWPTFPTHPPSPDLHNQYIRSILTQHNTKANKNTAVHGWLPRRIPREISHKVQYGKIFQPGAPSTNPHSINKQSTQMAGHRRERGGGASSARRPSRNERERSAVGHSTHVLAAGHVEVTVEAPAAGSGKKEMAERRAGKATETR